MIIVTGATGQLGRLIVEKLLTLVPSSRVGVSVRDPAKAADWRELGVRVRRGDFEDPASLADAFDGASQVLIVSSNAAATGGDPLKQHRAAIDAARAAGAQRVVYTSHMGASATSAFPPMLDHAATEDMLRASGLRWTALRNGFYAESGLMLMGDYASAGKIEAPADGRVSWTTHSDLAEAAALILAEERRFDGPTPPLTGSEALDLADLATIASASLGCPVGRSVIGDEAFEERLAARGVPPAAAAIVLGFYAASRAGEFDVVDSTLEQILGRRLTSMQDLISRALKTGQTL